MIETQSRPAYPETEVRICYTLEEMPGPIIEDEVNGETVYLKRLPVGQWPKPPARVNGDFVAIGIWVNVERAAIHRRKFALSELPNDLVSIEDLVLLGLSSR